MFLSKKNVQACSSILNKDVELQNVNLYFRKTKFASKEKTH